MQPTLSRSLALIALLGLSLTACNKDKGSTSTPTDSADPGPHPFEGTEVGESYELDGLSCPVDIVRTEGDIPHVYAENRADLAFGYGFVMAEHRFFELELARRLALGETSALLGQDGLDTDMESRGSAMRFVAEHLEANLTTEERELVDAYAGGVNAYIALAQAGKRFVK